MTVCIKSLIRNLNIVIGCTVGCPYCYARTTTRRFHLTDDFATPVYMPRKLRILNHPRPQTFLLTGMSDLSDWRSEWQTEVFDHLAQHPQHSYIFLTKRPDKMDLRIDNNQVWMGVTVTQNSEKWRIEALRNRIRAKHYHITFEPLFGSIDDLNLEGIEWIVIGTETGGRKGKVVANPDWIWGLVRQARSHHIPIFMKEELISIMGESNMIQELPAPFNQSI